MGDMADYALEQIFEAEDAWQLAVDGDGDPEEAYDYDGSQYPSPVNFRTEKYPPLRRVSSGPRMTFGKYKGQFIGNINSGYLSYAIRNFDKMPTEVRRSILLELRNRD